ncbi:MAG: hypothetical protein ACXW2C_08520, partial [Acidimicrobiia bacterium]
MAAGSMDPAVTGTEPIGGPDPDGRGTRRERRRRVERRRRILFVIPSVAIAVFGVFLIGQVVRDAADDGAAGPADTVDAGRVTSGADTLLLEHRAADGRADLLVVVGPGSGEGSSVLLIPAGTLSDVPSLGIQALSDVPTLGEAGLLTTTVENMLGIDIASTATVDDAALTAALQPAAPIPVDLRH